MSKKRVAAMALAAAISAPTILTATNALTASSFLAAEESVSAKAKVVFKIQEAGKPSDLGVTVDIIEKGNDKNKQTFDSKNPTDISVDTGKTYIFKVVKVPEGYKVAEEVKEVAVPAGAKDCTITIDVTKGGQDVKPTPNPDKKELRKVELKHIDADTKEALAWGKVEIIEKDIPGPVATVDFTQANKNIVDLEVGKTYQVMFTEKLAGYKPVKDIYMVKVEPNKDGKIENQVLVLESRKDADSKPVKPDIAEKLLVLQHIDADTQKEIKSGEVTVLEKGRDEKDAQKYDFSKEDNNIKVVNGKTYIVEFKREANGYLPLTAKQEIKVDFGEDTGDTYKAQVFSKAIGASTGTNTGTGSSTGGTTSGNTNPSGGLPKTGVAATSAGVALTGAIGSGLAIFRKRR